MLSLWGVAEVGLWGWSLTRSSFSVGYREAMCTAIGTVGSTRVRSRHRRYLMCEGARDRSIRDTPRTRSPALSHTPAPSAPSFVTCAPHPRLGPVALNDLAVRHPRSLPSERVRTPFGFWAIRAGGGPMAKPDRKLTKCAEPPLRVRPLDNTFGPVPDRIPRPLAAVGRFVVCCV